jgi:polyhydroxybutyrate depolymerase
MKVIWRTASTAITVGALLTTLLIPGSFAAGLDDGYPPGDAAPGRTCGDDALGHKTVSTYSGKALACIVIQGVAKWWIEGDPLPAVQTPTPAPAPAQTTTSAPKAPAPVVASNAYQWSTSVNIAKAKGSKFITTAGVRPTEVLIPGNIKPKVAAPLIIALHGFTATPGDLMSLMDLSTEATKRGVVLAVPSGTRNKDGLTFWNATPSCCDFQGSGVDDSQYLMNLVKEISSAVSIDPKRIYFVGHSNGGFMSYTVACNNSNKIAAIVSLEGSTYKDLSSCKADHPVSILQINGTVDELIHIDGGNVFDDPKQPYPSVKDETSFWAGVDGCTSTAATIKNKSKFNYESALAGAETSKESYKCPKGVAVEMWTLAGGHHVPKLNSTFVSALFDFLLAHHI